MKWMGSFPQGRLLAERPFPNEQVFLLDEDHLVTEPGKEGDLRGRAQLLGINPEKAGIVQNPT